MNDDLSNLIKQRKNSNCLATKFDDSDRIHDLDGLSAKLDESEISSTSAYRLGISHLDDDMENLIFDNYISSIHIDLGWNQFQFELAEMYILLMTKLANHPYPLLAISKENEVNRDHVEEHPINGDAQPDSSAECLNCFNSNYQNGNGTNDTSNKAFVQWYNLISSSMLNLIRHEHSVSETKVCI